MAERGGGAQSSAKKNRRRGGRDGKADKDELDGASQSRGRVAKEQSQDHAKSPRKGHGGERRPRRSGEKFRGENDKQGKRVTSPESKNQSQRGDRSGSKEKSQAAVGGGCFFDYCGGSDLEKGLTDGSLLSGVIRVNPKNYRESFIPEPGRLDVYLNGVPARNRALDGDLVAHRILPREQWRVFRQKLDAFKQNLETAELVGSVTAAEKLASGGQDILEDKYMQRTAEVVAILQERHSRIGIGFLHKYGPTLARFSPNDHRLPRVLVPIEQCPADFHDDPAQYENTLFVVKITNWPVDSDYANGSVLRKLGMEGDIEVETEGFLASLEIDRRPFSEEVMACLPKVPFRITAVEVAKRRDLRDEVAFTIDPETARDMDDALHWKKLDGGLHEVGVHIADVSYFVSQSSALDKEAGHRATSTYLINEVIPMLPRLLSNDLCSLCPNEDRLAVSVVWKLNDDAEIVDQWMGRTVIRSRAKLSYGLAQQVIDNPQRTWTAEDLRTTEAMIQPIITGLNALFRLTMCMTKKRASGGFLRLRQASRLNFNLSENLMPIGCEPPPSFMTQKLVEELMLLANMAVARFLADKQPSTAFLRWHPGPEKLALEEVQMFGRAVGLRLECHSVKAMQAGIDQLDDGTPLGKTRALVMANKLMTCLKPAEYYHLGMKNEREPSAVPTVKRHYALNVLHYTHFTSPIRRYADLIVHRQLLDSLSGVEWNVDTVGTGLKERAERCNQMKFRARKAGEASTELFFSSFVKLSGPLEEQALVADVLDQSFDVLLPKYNLIRRVHCNSLPLHGWTFDAKSHSMEIKWRSDDLAELASNPSVSAEDADTTASPSSSTDCEQRVCLFDRVVVIVRSEGRQGNPLSHAVYLKAPPGCSTNYGLSQNMDRSTGQQKDRKRR